jgi:hypothetical protein
MLADDAFRAQLRRVALDLRAWGATLAGLARVEESEGDTFWRLGVAPAARGACGFELILHFDQHADLAVGPEFYERMPIEDLALFPRLARVIAEGRVLTRTWTSRNTGAVRCVETVITLADGEVWQRQRLNVPLAAAISAEECVVEDHHYGPYRLG